MEPPFEMANLRPKSTGLPMVILVSEKGRSQHGPRIKVSLRHGDRMDALNTMTVTIEDEPQLIGEGIPVQDLEAIRRYISLNKHTLLGYWNGEIDTVELVANLKPVPHS
jgi:hypothetical protein